MKSRNIIKLFSILVFAVFLASTVGPVANTSLGNNKQNGNTIEEFNAHTKESTKLEGVDLDVMYISRTPRYWAHLIDYPDDIPQENSETAGKQHWPVNGEIVNFTAHIINKGNQSSGPFTFRWFINGTEIANGTHPSLAPGEEGNKTYQWPWYADHTSHTDETVKFEADYNNQISEICENNNNITDFIEARSFRFYVQTDFYAYFNTHLNGVGTYSFEDWAQWQISRMNQLFEEAIYPLTPEGIKERVRIDKIVVADDVDVASNNDPDKYKIDGAWSFGGDINSGWIEGVIQTIDWGLLHELTHQMGIIDLYQIPIENSNTQVIDENGFYVGMGCSWVDYDGNSDVLMFNIGHKYSMHTAYALNGRLPYRNGYYGEYLYDVPEKNYISVLDNEGNSVENASVTIYQKEFYKEQGWTGIDNVPEHTGSTNQSGFFLIPNASTPHVTTITNHTLHDNPFGKINVVGSNGLLLIKIKARGQTDYYFLDITKFNYEYWSGNTIEAVFTFDTHIPPVGAPASPQNLDVIVQGSNVDLSWTNSLMRTNENCSVYRGDWPTYTYNKIASGLAISTYSTTINTRSKFAVTIIDSNGKESAFSNIIVAPYFINPMAIGIDSQNRRTILDPQNGQALLRQGPNNRYLGYFGSVHYHLECSPDLLVDGHDRLIIAHPGDWYTTRNSIRIADINATAIWEIGDTGSEPGELNQPWGVAIMGEQFTVENNFTKDNHTLLLVHFNDNFTGEDGEEGNASNVNFTTGKFGQGVDIESNSQLIYPTLGNFNKTQGSIEFWFRPTLNTSSNQGRYLLEIGNSSQDKNKLFVWLDYCWWGSIPRTDMFNSTSGIFADLWMPPMTIDHWYHIAVTWKANDKLKIWINGERFGKSSSNISEIDEMPSLIYVGSRYGGTGQAKGIFDEMRFSDTPRVGNSDKSYIVVSEVGTHRISVFDYIGNFITSFGSYGAGNTNFNSPRGVGVLGNKIFVADSGNNRIQILDFNFTTQIITYNTTLNYSFNQPYDVALDSYGNIIVADTYNNKIKMFYPNLTFMREYTEPNDRYSGNFNHPKGIAVDRSNVIVVADTDNRRVVTIATPYSTYVIPIVNITYPYDGQIVNGTTCINGTASGSTGNVTAVYVKIDDDSWQLANGTTNWSFIWNTITVSKDWHTIYTKSFDGGCYSEIKNVTVYVNNTSIADLVAYWPLNEGSGTIVYDCSGNGNTGTISGATWCEGVNGSALSFDGVDDYVDCGNSASLNITTSFTIEAWVKRASLGSMYIVAKDRNPEPSGYGMYFNDNNKIVLFFADTFWRDTATSTSFTNTGVWYHIVGTHTSGSQKIYVNGIEQTLGVGGAYTVDPRISGNNLRIGAHSNPWQYFNGTIDEIRIYNRTLNAEEIRAHYVEFVGGLPLTVDITYPNAGQTVFGYVNITGTAYDANGNLSAVYVKIDNGSWQLANGTTNWYYGWNTTLISEGEHIIYAKSYDGTNYSEIKNITITVNTHCYMQLDVLVVIYTYTAGGNVSSDAIVKLKEEINEARVFYWRNSHLKLNLNIAYMVIDTYKDITEFWYLWEAYWMTFWDTDGDGNSVEQDIRNNGVINNQYDGVFVFYGWGENSYPAALGGGTYGVDIGFLGQTGYSAVPLCWSPDSNDWYFLHEFHHQLDSMFGWSGYSEYPHADIPCELSGDFGENHDFNAYILRNWSTEKWFVLSSPWGTIVNTTDDDLDGIPDNDPNVPIDEQSFSSNPYLKDSDSDGLSDLQEIMAGIYNGSNPNIKDTDGDGIEDGNDTYPLYPVNTQVSKSIIILDGNIETSWTQVSTGLIENNSDTFTAITYISWDDAYLYLGMKINKFSAVRIYLDANNDGWFHGKDNYEIVIDPSYSNISLQVGKVHIWDCSDTIINEFGYPLWDDDSSYPYSRNIVESDIGRFCVSDGYGGYIIELAIPKNTSLGLNPILDKKIGIRYHFADIDRNGSLYATPFEYYSFVDMILKANDTTPPISFVNPISPYWQTSTPITITAIASDDSSGVANVSLYYRYSNNNSTWGNWTLFGTDSASPWSWSFNFPNGTGYYEFYTRARDNATNYEVALVSADAICKYEIVGLIPHAPIYINGNDDFAAQAANNSWAGNGTQSNPYVIENYDINASSAHGIWIENTNIYFIIRNCTIYDGKSSYKYGIYLCYVTNGKINNVTSYNNYDGICLESSSNNNITSNHIYNNHAGIWLWDGPNNILRNNILENNTYNFGAHAYAVWNLYQDIDTTNTVNGKPIYYIIEQSNMTFDGIDVGYLGLISCRDILVKNLTLKDNIEGLYLANTSHSTITANRIYNNQRGIIVWGSSNNNTIAANDIYNNEDGICLDWFSSYNEIISNQIHHNVYGGLGLSYASNTKIATNHIYNNEGGIRLDVSPNNTIMNCDIYNNSWFGIGLQVSSNTEIHYCNIYNNTDYAYSDYGISNSESDPQYVVNATYNWWGSASGPSGVGPGNGDVVSGNVIYDPWLTEPYHLPSITITQPEEGLITNQNVNLEYIIDVPLTSTGNPIEVNIDGPPNGTIYTTEGGYNITIIVTDGAGNTTTTTVSFTIDKTDPVIGLTGVANNTYYNVSVVPVIEVLDINLNTSTITLNGVSFASSTPVTEDGDYVLVVQASDYAGNTVSMTLLFTIDKTSPEITVTGVADNAYYNISVTPVIDITDLNLNITSITLNGDPFSSGTIASVDDEYTLIIHATDKAGNKASETISFTIDKTNPNITISGVMDGTYYNISVTPVIEFNDTNLNITTITLNGVAFASGTTITGEADYVLVAYASDKAGNTAQRIVSFAIDKTKPVLEILSPANNTITNQSVTLTYSLTDNFDVFENIAVNIPNGTVYSDEKSYTVMVNATDRAGNTAIQIITFVVDKTPPGISDISPATGTKTTKSSLVVSGKTEPDATMKINGVDVPVSSDGSFSKELTLAKGENTITITATDMAGNTKTETIIVTKTEKKQEKGFIPGFEAFLLLIVLTGCAGIGIRRRKKSPPEKPADK